MNRSRGCPTARVPAAVLCLALLSCSPGGPLLVPVTVFGERTVTFRAEVADSSLERMKGLMFREELAADRAMLFVYPEPQWRNFWMMHTTVPLDIVFVDSQKRVLNVREAEPCPSSPCPRYASAGPAQYVLEVRRGLSEQYGFRAGTRLAFSLP